MISGKKIFILMNAEWRRVIYGGRMWVFQQSFEKRLKDRFAQEQKGQRISFMLRGCICGGYLQTFSLLFISYNNEGFYVILLEYYHHGGLNYMFDTQCVVVATHPGNLPVVRVRTATTGWSGFRPVERPDPMSSC